MAKNIAQWLNRLGLADYAKTFAENGVELQHLPYLTDDDLKELGLPLGPRRHLQAAIETLSADDPPIPLTVPSAQEPEVPSADAERRQLTVMFCDLVGSTALSGRLDPEDLRELILGYQKVVAGEISRFEGHVAKYMGDGVLAYFGWPRAHEDEAERAVGAALAVTAAVAKLRTPADEPLATRTGIATGLVVVGDFIGEGAAREQTVVGDTPNLAARLQGLAEPDAVVISDATRRLLGEMFELRALGPQTLKGIAEPVPVYTVVRERAVESRFEAHRGGAAPMLVGRDEELALVLRRWQQAKAGEGRMILLTGEAGIGKSGLLRAVGDTLKGQPHYRINDQCSPYHTDSALYPVIQQLTRAAQLSSGESTETKLDKLEALLGLALADPAEHAPLIAALLGIDGEARYGKLDLTPQQQRTRTLHALVAQLTGLAQHQPVLFVLEDAHWIDPTTLELIELAIDAGGQARVLLLITARPTFEHHFDGHPIVTRIMLNRLGREPVIAIIHRLTGGKAIPEELMDEIVAKTDGVPLFVEELTKTVLESGLLRETADAYMLDGPLRSIDIPGSLHDSLMARLDRLQPIRDVVQTAACIGRELGHELLAAVAGHDAEHLRAALEQLIEAELMYRRGLPPDAVYTFKHALVRDAAYESLLRSKRQAIHARIAQMLEERFPETVDAEPELLAHHFTEAGQAERAVDYWSKAGRRALVRSAYAEVIAHTGTGLGLLGTLAGGSERHQRELELQNSRAQALLSTRGWAAPETGAAFAAARKLCRALGNPSATFPVLHGLYSFHFSRGQYGSTLDIGHECLDLAEKQNDGAAAVLAHRIIGQVLFYSGELTVSRRHLEQAIALYDPQRHGASALNYGGADPKNAALVWLSQLLWVIGYPDHACRAADEALNDAERQEGMYEIANTFLFVLQMRFLRRDYRAVLQGAQRLSALAREHGSDLFLLFAEGLSLRARLAASRRGEDIAPFAENIASMRANGQQARIPDYLGLLAEALAMNGRVEEALATIAEALEMTDRNGERWSEAELHRLKGEILRVRDGAESASEAESSFLQSLDIAREQGAKSWELRAATSLARLRRDQGKRSAARDLLAPVYEWFTEGFDTADLKEANALLEELI